MSRPTLRKPIFSAMLPGLRLRNVTVALVLAILLLPGAGAAQDATGSDVAQLDAEQLIANNLEARGGRGRLESLESARIRGGLDLGESGQAPFTLEWRAPNRVRMEMTMEGIQFVQAFDGEVAWRITPFTGPEPQVVTGDEAAALERMAFDSVRGPLFDPGRRGWRVEYLGVEQLDSRATHKLRLSRADHEVLLWLDGETFLETRLEEEVPQPGGKVKVVTRPGDFRAVEGLRFPFSVVQQMEGAPEAQRFRIQNIELGIDIDDDRFTLVLPESGEGEGSGGG